MEVSKGRYTTRKAATVRTKARAPSNISRKHSQRGTALFPLPRRGGCEALKWAPERGILGDSWVPKKLLQ